MTIEACASAPHAEASIDIHLPLPAEAMIEPVSWIDKPDLGGLLLPYSEYRKLGANIIEYRREIAELRDLARFYGSGD